MNRKWPVQDAKSKFSELLDITLAEGPQIVTKRGVETAVLLPIEQWRRLERMTSTISRYIYKNMRRQSYLGMIFL